MAKKKAEDRNSEAAALLRHSRLWYQCENCEEMPSRHVNGKCLFGATDFSLSRHYERSEYHIIHTDSGTVVVKI
jgi:hypothetical protein